MNYDLWLGPAPEREFSENRHHYNWHWHWDYGNGDIGNQGVHQMDIARWGLGVGLPKQVSSTAHMVLWDDDKEVPNLIHTSFHYPDEGKIFDFDTRPWYTNDEKGAKIGVTFYGSEGYMVIDSYSHYKVYLGKNEEPGPERDAGGDHYANFIEAVRAGKPELLNAPIEEGHLSSALCHLGLVSARLADRSSSIPRRRFLSAMKRRTGISAGIIGRLLWWHERSFQLKDAKTRRCLKRWH